MLLQLCPLYSIGVVKVIESWQLISAGGAVVGTKKAYWGCSAEWFGGISQKCEFARGSSNASLRLDRDWLARLKKVILLRERERKNELSLSLVLKDKMNRGDSSGTLKLEGLRERPRLTLSVWLIKSTQKVLFHLPLITEKSQRNSFTNSEEEYF